MTGSESIGAVVIGRNEGERLKRCLRSLVPETPRVVYVDSGSSDGSVEFARSLGVDVLDLDMSRPFTMARGRNTGFARLLGLHPGLRFVQFVDGDCEVVAGWIAAGLAEIELRADVAAVCGRRRERHPDRSLYNRLIDAEWAGMPGEVRSCGGDVIMRVEAFRSVGGFNEALIAGEEPELCFRLRRDGWKIVRLDREMTVHDAAMTRFSQWWRRSVRGGHACAEAVAMHGRSPERYYVRPLLSALAWGVGLPVCVVASLALAFLHAPWWIVPGAAGVGLLLGQVARLAVAARGALPWREAALHAAFCMLAKAPRSWGAVVYAANRVRGRRAGLIEYRGPEARVLGGAA